MPEDRRIFLQLSVSENRNMARYAFMRRTILHLPISRLEYRDDGSLRAAPEAA